MVIDNSSELIAKVLLLNPVAQIIQDARYNAVSHETITTSGLIDNVFIESIPYLLVVMTIVFATFYFKNRQKYFAENI